MNEPQRSLDGYGADEMAVPEWRLIQKTGGDWAKQLGAKPGDFFNTISDEIAQEINLVVVDILSGRARWGEEIENVGPICASLDAKSNKSIFGNDCSQCEYRADAPWSLDAVERRKMCCLNYTILGIDLDHDYLPMMIRAHGISTLPVRQLITQLKMNRALRGEYHKAVVNIKSISKDTPYGTTYSIHLKIVELITDEAKAEELKVESQRLLGAPIALPEGRPDEEIEPLGFTPDGTPFYSEEERDRLLAPTPEPTQPAPLPPESAVPNFVQPPVTETKPPEEEKKETGKKEPLDLDF